MGDGNKRLRIRFTSEKIRREMSDGFGHLYYSTRRHILHFLYCETLQHIAGRDLEIRGDLRSKFTLGFDAVDVLLVRLQILYFPDADDRVSTENTDRGIPREISIRDRTAYHMQIFSGRELFQYFRFSESLFDDSFRTECVEHFFKAFGQFVDDVECLDRHVRLARESLCDPIDAHIESEDRGRNSSRERALHIRFGNVPDA